MLGPAGATGSIFRLAFHGEKGYGARSPDVVPPSVACGTPRPAVSGEWEVERGSSLQGIGDNS